MDRFFDKMIRKMSDNITSFWLVEPNDEEMRSYKDFPVCPFGPTRLINKETLKKLMK